MTTIDYLRNFSSSHFRHRCIANDIAISAILQGFKVSTEREISQALWLGGELGIEGKKPDVLIRSDDNVWWVEVEKSRKNAKDYAGLLTWLGKVARDAFGTSGPALLGNKLRWGQVVFVCTSAFQAKLRKDLAAAGWKQVHFDRLVLFDSTLYSFEEIAFG